MSEIIKVKINTDAVTATEVNRLKKPINIYKKWYDGNNLYTVRYNNWQEAESELRTFKIDFSHLNDFYRELESKVGGKISHVNQGFETETIRSAEILDNDKLTIRIL